MSSRRALWLLVATMTLLRLAWAACLGPGNDEAYYYLFTVHRDWSYYDHPPLMALVEGIGLGMAGGAVSALALRLGFVGLFAGTTLLMARLSARWFGPWAGVLAAFALNVTAYFGLAAGTFALPDGPLVFFWLLTLDRLTVALERPDRCWEWVGVGLAWGGALLSKYHAVLLPLGTLLYLAVEPTARPWLRRPGPYLAVVVGLIVFAPVIAWNAAHDWASFAFQGSRAVAGYRPRLDTLAAAVVGQALYLFPWMWAFLVAALARRRRGTTPAERFFLCHALPPLMAFLAVACGRAVLPHWSLAGFLAAMPLLGRDWAARPGRLRRRLTVLGAVPVLGMVLVVGQARWGWLPIAAESDPTVETYGWEDLARELERRGLVGRPETFLFTSKWYHSGHLAFALAGRAPVLCYHPRDPHGFAQWDNPSRQVGRDGILVVVDRSSTEPAMYDRWFERIEPVGAFSIERAGATVRRVRLYRCVRQTGPFPGPLASAATTRSR